MSLLLFRAVPSPRGEIQRFSSPIYIGDHQPGNRSYVAIPGPHGAIGMAIVTRALKHSHRPRVHCKSYVHFALWIDWGICSGWLKDLTCQQDHEERNNEALQPDLHHFLLP